MPFRFAILFALTPVLALARISGFSSLEKMTDEATLIVVAHVSEGRGAGGFLSVTLEGERTLKGRAVSGLVTATTEVEDRDANGNYNRATLSVNPNGTPGSPSWSIPINSDKLFLSCTNCTLPLITSLKPSENCTFDIGVRVSYDGFRSNPFLMNVNAPWFVEPGGPSETINYFDGWKTFVFYATRDRCTAAMTGIAFNETFGTFQSLTANNWAKPVAEGKASYPGYFWTDQMSIFNCFLPECIPLVEQGNPVGQASVDQVQQFWQIGSATPGLGIYVQQNTFRRYTGHGEHLNILRVLY